MQPIKKQLELFFNVTGMKKIDLARAAGIPNSYICKVIKGEQKSMTADNADKLRLAMAEHLCGGDLHELFKVLEAAEV